MDMLINEQELDRIAFEHYPSLTQNDEYFAENEAFKVGFRKAVEIYVKKKEIERLEYELAKVKNEMARPKIDV